jgi:hypothetical protein
MGTSQAKMPSSSGGFRNYLKDPSRTTREYYDDGDGFRVAREDSGGASASTAACPTPSSTTSTLAAGTAWAQHRHRGGDDGGGDRPFAATRHTRYRCLAASEARAAKEAAFRSQCWSSP